MAKLNEHYDCNIILTKVEQTILFKRFNKGQVNTASISVKQALNGIGKLGGYIGRKNDLPRGIITIWRGWTRFMNMVDDYKIICG